MNGLPASFSSIGEVECRNPAEQHVHDGRIELKLIVDLLQLARHGDIFGAVVAAQLFDVHCDEELVLQHQDFQAFEHVGQVRDLSWKSGSHGGNRGQCH